MPPVLLIMGLPTSGKTALADACAARLRAAGLSVTHISDDAVRSKHDDWDFSRAGGIRQAQRLLQAANASRGDLVGMDFVAGLSEQRAIVAPNAIVWLDTVKARANADSDAAFVPPAIPDLVFTAHSPDNIDRVARLAHSRLRLIHA